MSVSRRFSCALLASLAAIALAPGSAVAQTTAPPAAQPNAPSPLEAFAWLAGCWEGKINLREVERARLEENETWMLYLNANFQRQQAQLDLLQTAGQLDKVWQ